MERKISKEKYIFALLITLLVFSSGLILGLYMEGKRAQSIDLANKEQKLDFSSLQLQYAFLDQLRSDKDCTAVQRSFEENVKGLDNTREKLENYQQDAWDKQEFENLRREYTIAQVNYWVLFRKAKEICSNDAVDILYFYSTKDECPRCDDQAFVLTYLKKNFGNSLLNFVFDGNMKEEPLIPLMKSAYNISSYPTLVVNGRVYHEFKSLEELLAMVCPDLARSASMNNTLCKPYVSR
ncbi:hypothetical protein HZB02_05575 [Candidatus Woesearchaeota archaeon]|nr:hypothetical protein [Candidatus Woesearchaeota archaeon]